MEARVRVSSDIDLDYMGVLREGERGTIVAQEWDSGKLVGADVRMDEYHAGLAMWDNVAHLVEPEVDNIAVVKPSLLSLNSRRLVKYALAAAIAFFAIIGGWEMVCGDDLYPHAHAAHAGVLKTGANESHGQPQEAAGRRSEDRSAGATKG